MNIIDTLTWSQFLLILFVMAVSFTCGAVYTADKYRDKLLRKSGNKDGK